MADNVGSGEFESHGIKHRMANLLGEVDPEPSCSTTIVLSNEELVKANNDEYTANLNTTEKGGSVYFSDGAIVETLLPHLQELSLTMLTNFQKNEEIMINNFRKSEVATAQGLELLGERIGLLDGKVEEVETQVSKNKVDIEAIRRYVDTWRGESWHLGAGEKRPNPNNLDNLMDPPGNGRGVMSPELRDGLGAGVSCSQAKGAMRESPALLNDPTNQTFTMRERQGSAHSPSKNPRVLEIGHTMRTPSIQMSLPPGLGPQIVPPPQPSHNPPSQNTVLPGLHPEGAPIPYNANFLGHRQNIQSTSMGTYTSPPLIQYNTEARSLFGAAGRHVRMPMFDPDRKLGPRFLAEAEEYFVIAEIYTDYGKRTIFPLMLGDKAKEWYQDNREYMPTWQSLQSGFLERFHSPFEMEKRVREWESYMLARGDDIEDYVSAGMSLLPEYYRQPFFPFIADRIIRKLPRRMKEVMLSSDAIFRTKNEFLNKVHQLIRSRDICDLDDRANQWHKGGNPRNYSRGPSQPAQFSPPLPQQGSGPTTLQTSRQTSQLPPFSAPTVQNGYNAPRANATQYNNGFTRGGIYTRGNYNGSPQKQNRPLLGATPKQVNMLQTRRESHSMGHDSTNVSGHWQFVLDGNGQCPPVIQPDVWRGGHEITTDSGGLFSPILDQGANRDISDHLGVPPTNKQPQSGNE